MSAPAPQSNTPQAEVPAIADLTYRTYDGPLHTRAMRWWIVSVSVFRSAVRSPLFWILAALSLLPYVFTGFMLFIESMAPAGTDPSVMGAAPEGQRFAFRFYESITSQSFFWLLLVALLVGSRAIAADNRSNALMVYLSKPLTKGDYVFGKWMGVFLTLWSLALAPALLLFLYCLLSFYSDGFLKQEPWLILRIVAATAVPALINTSVLLGFSAWSRSPALAGACYAGAYFASYAIAMAAWGIVHHGDLSEGILMRHCSIPGIAEGLVQHVMGTNLAVASFHRTRMFEQLSLAPPSLPVMAIAAAVLIGGGLAAARYRVRAVEVVRG